MPELFTTIESVNIFRNGAEVIRKGKTELKEGSQTLYIHGLSETAETDSARIFSLPGVECANLRFEYPDADDSERPSNKLSKEIELLRKQVEARELQISLWTTNGNFSGRDSANVEDVERYIEKLPERLVGLHEELLKLNDRIKELNKKLEEAKDGEDPILLVADVCTASAGEYPFELRYHENDAGWRSVYEIHSDRKEDLEIKQRARIYENTHEDWKNVRVTLYSGDPTNSGSLPELQPIELELSEKQPVKVRVRKQKNMLLDAMAVPTEAVGGMAMMTQNFSEIEPSMRMETEEADVSSDETMTEYFLNGNRDILKEGDGTLADLQSCRIATVYKTVTVPKSDPNAYLIASIRSADLPFFDMRTADIYLNGVYTNKLHLDNDLTKEDIELTLGKEERLHVSHRDISKKTSNALLKAQTTVEHVYETTLNNLADEEVTVLLRDQVPVSGNKDISVELVETAGEPDKETGLFEKELKIGPKQSEKVRLAYKVAYPKGKYLNETFKSAGRRCSSCGSEIAPGLRFCPECGAPV